MPKMFLHWTPHRKNVGIPKLLAPFLCASQRHYPEGQSQWIIATCPLASWSSLLVIGQVKECNSFLQGVFGAATNMCDNSFPLLVELHASWMFAHLQRLQFEKNELVSMQVGRQAGRYIALQENVVLLTQKGRDSWHMWSKPCGFLHNAQYVGFIMAYITSKLQFHIKL
jgi:hypothetical protein